MCNLLRFSIKCLLAAGGECTADDAYGRKTGTNSDVSMISNNRFGVFVNSIYARAETTHTERIVLTINVIGDSTEIATTWTAIYDSNERISIKAAALLRIPRL